MLDSRRLRCASGSSGLDGSADRERCGQRNRMYHSGSPGGFSEDARERLLRYSSNDEDSPQHRRLTEQERGGIRIRSRANSETTGGYTAQSGSPRLGLGIDPLGQSLRDSVGGSPHGATGLDRSFTGMPSLPRPFAALHSVRTVCMTAGLFGGRQMSYSELSASGARQQDFWVQVSEQLAAQPDFDVSTSHLIQVGDGVGVGALWHDRVCSR